jgi:hypothetical protein
MPVANGPGGLVPGLECRFFRLSSRAQARPPMQFHRWAGTGIGRRSLLRQACPTGGGEYGPLRPMRK